ncbi:hypothetical protein Enr13x_73400 [Stieleria neptunia]|uniref:ISKra4 family transposase n=2 Tax=Stieleria TaxID=2795973 RepID=A0A518HJQ7_9BACT|nr:hypothetical protein [Stieleria neptunia]QDV41084.1 hypothetical protein Enr13x_09220 [Stieleria neptunia]QDV47431.1 hypothetical protein Enr13x_73400 [Stieleria neptunia]
MGQENGERIESAEEMLALFYAQLVPKVTLWKQRISDHPEQLATLERTIHDAFARGADMVVAGLISATMIEKGFEKACQSSRVNFSRPLQKGRETRVAVRLLGGMLFWATALYCAPKKKLLGRDDSPRVGLHVSLAQFGFGKGVSPALESRVARQVALCPSIEVAHRELVRDGITLDIKAVKRIAYQSGDGLLRLRRHRLKLFRQGKLASTGELAGKRVSVQIDGGRMKIRGKMLTASTSNASSDDVAQGQADSPGRSAKKPARSFEADWREPKLMTIFVHDEQGRMVKEHEATIDGTLTGPDAIAELVAMHLHRLGAAEAHSVTFVADGAPWIWDRIDRIIQYAGLTSVVTHQVLDCCHAVHHVSKAIASLGLDADVRQGLYRQYRTLLRNGQWRRVVDELAGLERVGKSATELETEIHYLCRHGEAGRLSYPAYRRSGIPCGSGAIESSIRRVINLRLKSNAMFWKSENAEQMLQVRAHLIPDRWDESIGELAEFRRTQASDSWHWEPRPMSCKVEATDQQLISADD